MSLNKISLTPQLIADLYPISLIDHKTLDNKQETLKFLGKNQKNILILVSKDNVAFLEEEELSFLSTVLAACKLNLADMAVINLNQPKPPDYRDLTKQLKSKIVLLFGIEAQTIDLPFNFPHFQLQQFDQCTYLSAPALKNIETDKALKAQLWNCLKNLFRL